MRRALAVVSFGLLAACATVIGVDSFEVGDCKGGKGAECIDAGEVEDSTVDKPDTNVPDVVGFDASAPCDSGGRETGPTLVRVGPPDNSFCIDRTEVTNAQYAQFLEAGVDAATQDPECKWNASFAPISTGTNQADFPVAGIDWCDAYAYCKWAGKYLCGKVVGGKRVGPLPQAEVGDYNTHQWMIACSAQTNRYPYGSIQDASLCNVGELDAGGPVAVASLPGCEGSYKGVFDLLGNVWEWYDGPCRSDAGLGGDAGDAGPAADECWVKGGGFNRAGSNIDCRVDGLGSRRDTRATFIGFRCCSD